MAFKILILSMKMCDFFETMRWKDKINDGTVIQAKVNRKGSL